MDLFFTPPPRHPFFTRVKLSVLYGSEFVFLLFSKLIEKLTASLKIQEFSFRNITVTVPLPSTGVSSKEEQVINRSSLTTVMSRERQIIEETILVVGIVRMTLKGCFDTLVVSSLRPPSVFHGCSHLFLDSSSADSLSSQRSLQRARAVQAEIVPVPSNRRQPVLLVQLLTQEPREPSISTFELRSRIAF
jgi:hypothetical protein